MVILSPSSNKNIINFDNRFQWIDEKLYSFIYETDFKLFNETDNIHNSLEAVTLRIKKEIEYIFDSQRQLSEINIFLKDIEEFIAGYFLQIFQKTSTFVVVCKWKNRIISNEAFKTYTWKDTNDVTELYSQEELVKINQYTNSMINWNILWYLQIFTNKISKIWWTTILLPSNDKINIRFWFELWKNNDYSDFYDTCEINDIIFSEDDFYFTKLILKKLKEIKDIKYLLVWIKQINFNNYINNIKVLALILDYMIKFSPNPLVLYKWTKPLILSNSYLKITWYSKEEIFNYFEKNWEITTLLYKWDDLKQVLDFVEELKNKWELWSWYDGIYFTLTTKQWKRIKISWSNHIYFDKNKRELWELSLRTWDIWKMEVYIN